MTDQEPTEFHGDELDEDGQPLESPAADADPGDGTDGAGELGDIDDYDIPELLGEEVPD